MRRHQRASGVLMTRIFFLLMVELKSQSISRRQKGTQNTAALQPSKWSVLSRRVFLVEPCCCLERQYHSSNHVFEHAC